MRNNSTSSSNDITIDHDLENEDVETEETEEEDKGDSDVSEERNSEDLINGLTPVNLDSHSHSEQQKRPDDIVSVINNAFNDRKTFSCPKIKSEFFTGTSISNLSPEDIGIIGAMGDSMSVRKQKTRNLFIFQFL